MKRAFQGIGRLAYVMAWPAFWAYFRFGHGRTRVIVWRGNEILMVKQWVGDGRWQLPGGGMHAGELPAASAIRELYEETGLLLSEDQLVPLGESLQKSRGSAFTMYVFKAQWRDTNLKLQRIEIAEATWMRPDELTARNTSPDVLAALQMLQ